MDRRLFIAALALAPLPALASEKAEKKKGGGASFIQMRPITSTILRRDGRRGVLTVEAGLDVPDGGLRGRAEASTPRLQAAFAQILQTYATGLPPSTAPNADFLAREMQRETDRVLGKKGARLLVGTILVN